MQVFLEEIRPKNAVQQRLLGKSSKDSHVEFKHVLLTARNIIFEEVPREALSGERVRMGPSCFHQVKKEPFGSGSIGITKVTEEVGEDLEQ